MRRLADVALSVSHFRDIADVSLDVFGPLTGSQDEQLAQLRAAYRKLTLVVHPDRFVAGSQDAWLAQQTFVKITNIKDQMEARILKSAPLLTDGGRYPAPSSTGIDVYRPQPIGPVQPSHGYDEPSHPPLPNCVCVALAKQNLPYRTIYYSAGQNQEWATIYGERKNVVEHGQNCIWYRASHPSSISKESSMSFAGPVAGILQGWFWKKSALDL